MEQEAKENVTVRLLEPFLEQTVNEMVGSRKRDFGVRGSRLGSRKMGLEWIYFIGGLRDIEVTDYTLLKDLELRAGKMLKWRVMCKEVTQLHAAQHAAIARLQDRLWY